MYNRYVLFVTVEVVYQSHGVVDVCLHLMLDRLLQMEYHGILSVHEERKKISHVAQEYK